MNEVLIIETNFAGNGVHAMSIAKELGYRTRFLTQDIRTYENCRLNPNEYADEVMAVDTSNPIAMLRLTADLSPVTILAYDDFALLPAAFLAMAHNLCTRAKLVGLINAKFKDRTRNLCKDLDVSIPYSIMSADDTTHKSPFGYPCIVKPVDNSGSVDVRVCETQIELEEAFERIFLARANDSEDFRHTEVLVEPYIAGPEFSAEFAFDNERDEWVLLGYVRKIVSPPPFCVELGHVCPHYFDNETSFNIESQLLQCLTNIGIRETVAHVEFKLVDKKPVLIEINARPAGGMIAELFKMSCGIDLIANHVRSNIGLPLPNNKPKVPSIYCAIWFITHQNPARVVAIDGNREPDEYDEDGVREVYTKQMPIDIQGLTNGDDRLGFVIASATSSEKALQLAQERVECLNITVARNNLVNGDDK